METPNFATGAADPRFATEDPVLPEYRRVDAECGEWPADHKDALYKCGQLDVSFAALLPAANDANVNSSSIDKGDVRLLTHTTHQLPLKYCLPSRQLVFRLAPHKVRPYATMQMKSFSGRS